MVRIYKVCHFVCVFFIETLLKLITDCWFYTLLVLLFVLEILKKKIKEKISFFIFLLSTDHFQIIFFYFFRPIDPKSEIFSRKSTNKYFWPKN